MKKLISLFTLSFCFLFMAMNANAVPLTGTLNIPGDYGTLALAITDLNTQGVGAGGVTLNVLAGNPQTSPAGGYIVGGAGSLVLTSTSLANQVTIQGNGNTITASGSLTSGSLIDGIFKLIGADWITVTGFTMLENPANTTTAAASNNMTEWGVALLYVTTTDGAQNNTIQNNTITLNRTYQNTWGIYSNSTHSSTVITTTTSATTTAGGNSGLKVYGNTISNVNQGICVVGPLAAADMNTGVDIGGTSVAQGNSITNWGTTGTFSGYVNVSGTLNCILVRNSTGYTISFNTLTSSVGGNTTTTNERAIFVPAFSNTPTGTFSNTINNNNISVQAGFITCILSGIIVETTTGTATSSLNVSTNNFNTFGHTVASPTGAVNFINITMAQLNTTITFNTFTAISLTTTGSVLFIGHSVTNPAGGTDNISNNSIVTSFAKTGTGGGTITFINNSAGSSTTVTQTWNNNNFSNITVPGTTTIAGIVCTDGGTVNHSANFNTVSNITGGTGSITGILSNFGGGNGGNGNEVTGNTVTNISSAGAITGINVGGSGTSTTVSLNTVATLASTGASLVVGITSLAPTSANIFKNKVYDLSNSNGSGTVTGIAVTGGTLHTVFNNLVGDLRTINASAANPLIGINVTGGTTINVYYNTVYMSGTSSSGTFGSSAISVSTTPTVTLRNNIFENLTVPKGAGLAVSYRRSSSSLATYGAASDRNDFFASTVYTDGTGPNTFVSIGPYQTLVGPTRDANSISVAVPFQSVVSGNPNFLKVDLFTPTQIESGAANISGITDDFENDIRQGNLGYPPQFNGGGTAPDIGADEFDGTPAVNMSYSTSITEQITGSAYQGVNNQAIIRVKVVTTGSLSPISLTSLTLNANGSTDITDINATSAKVYYTGASTTFSISSLFGSATPTIADFVVGGSQVLGQGDNYFWLAYDVTPTATPGDVIDGECIDMTVNSIVQIPTVTAPSGNKVILGPLAGDYTVGTAFFNSITGRNITFERVVKRVMKEVLEIDNTQVNNKNSNVDYDLSSQLNSLKSRKVMKEVEEVSYVPMENGRVYEGPLYVKRSENPNLPDNAMMGIYATITAAVADLNLRGSSAAVRFLLTDGSYTTGETYPITINQWSGSSSSNTLTILPDASVTTTITGTGSATFLLNGADYVTFDGSNNGSSSRDMTIQNTNATGIGVWVGSASASNGATNNTVKNCNMSGASGTSTIAGILSGSASVLGNPAESPNSNLTIQNNVINKVQNAVFINGNATTLDLNDVISGNTFGSSVTAEKLGFRGMLIANAQNFSVSNNNILGVSSSTGTSSTMQGIQVSGNISNGSVNGNRITDIRQNNTTGWGAAGILLGTTTTSSNLTVSNNSISDVRGAGFNGVTSTDNGYGIMIDGGGGFNIYYNSVSMNTNQTAAGSITAAINISSAITTAGSLNIRNNVFSNTETVGSNRYSIYSGATASVYSDINYNLYYFGTSPNLGFLTSNRANLTAWKSATGKDSYSYVGDPAFTSTTDLSPILSNTNCWFLNGNGIALSGLGTDINGNTRSTTIAGGGTDIGAYEFTPSVAPPVLGFAPSMSPLALDNDFILGGETVARIDNLTIGTLSQVDLQYYSGTVPPGLPGSPPVTDGYGNVYWDIQPTGTGFTYDLTIHYSPALLGNIVESAIKVAIEDPPNNGNGFYTPYPQGILAGQSDVDLVNHNIKVRGLTTMGKFIITDANGALPVELASFVSTINGRNVTLNWATTSEENNSGFDVERSSVNGSWSKIGNVAGNGTTSNGHSYSITDRNLASGNYSYRLKQIDFNGNFKYYNLSNEVIIGVPEKYELSQNYPNPFNPSTKISYDIPFDGKVSLTVFDISGKEVGNLVNEVKTAGYYTVNFNASNLSSGTYFYRINAEGNGQNFVSTKKMMLVK